MEGTNYLELIKNERNNYENQPPKGYGSVCLLLTHMARYAYLEVWAGAPGLHKNKMKP